nr:rab3 GTPase-activating protein catalytic subunit [Ipomoea trifida]GMC74536.1 rab3 GTPase-activating protein catalytic subunit [Ipomoea batatas]
MEPSFVSRARTALHSAAAKAEKVFTDIKKSDPAIDPVNAEHFKIQVGDDSDQQSPETSTPGIVGNKDGPKGSNEGKSLRWKPPQIKAKQDWQDRLKSIRIGKRGAEDTEDSTMAYAIFDENLYLMRDREFPEQEETKSGSLLEDPNFLDAGVIPPSVVLKQLAVAIESGKKYNSMKDLLASSRGSSPIREKASLSFSAVKSLVLREKDASELGSDDKGLCLITSLLDAEGHSPESRVENGSETSTNSTSLPKDIHGAPPECFIIKLGKVIGSLKTLQRMALFWSKIVAELRRLWSEGQYIPGIPPDEIPDLNSCLLYQQLQVINCCVSRKRRNILATEQLNSVERLANSNLKISDLDTSPGSRVLYAKLTTGELVLRLGVNKLSDLQMLETGEPIYTAVIQEAPLLTEDIIKETEEFVLRTGSVGAGCSQLLSDMQAFKAANPGCILEDFVRWHSPPDWMENESSESNVTLKRSDSSVRGQLSTRMQKEGNLWRELWETSKPIPAVRQTPLYDEDLAVEGILDALEDISPSMLFEQLFISLIGSGFVIAESTLSPNSSLLRLFYECKDYIVLTCQCNTWVKRVDDICQVYETVETMVVSPDGVGKITVQHEENTPVSELKSRFRRLGSSVFGRDKNAGKGSPTNSEENLIKQSISSIFSKKPPKHSSTNSGDIKFSSSVDNDWTIV